MKPAVALKKIVEDIPEQKSDIDAKETPVRPTILVATIDPAIRSGLTDLFQTFSLEAIWMKGVEAAKNALARERIIACLCGFWLQDGTYRELVRYIRRERMDIPVIIVSAPACPDEYRNFLEAMNIGALDFLSYPYRKGDLERMLWLATEPNQRSVRRQASAIGPVLPAGETV